MIQALSVFAQAVAVNCAAVIFYSQHADHCNVTNFPDYVFLYTMSSLNDTMKMLSNVNNLSDAGANTVYAVIGPVSDSTNGTSPSGTPNPFGSSISTAVAMIILYAITGVITVLFLIIIVTGAVRAHRHPERYGPRNGVGRPRQSRARGLARAMLEGLPIVKFGEREEDRAKPTDVELAQNTNGQQAQREIPDDAGTTEGVRDPSAAEASVSSPVLENDSLASPHGASENTEHNGIAPAAASERPPEQDHHLGCSICTEDFEVGQDQRVLPCDHRFHPACIDPWLLNVSGTCPLCRIDLRPATPGGSTDGDAEDDQNRDATGTTGMAPPLGATDDRRLSVRRSIVYALMLGRPETMSREERLVALRQLRIQQAARRRREEQEAVAETPEEQVGLHRRLRNAFHIRTRRTGQNGQPQEIAEVPESSTSPTEPNNSTMT